LKLIATEESGEELLFDLGTDPLEQARLASHPGAEELRRALAERVAANAKLRERVQGGKPGEEVVLDEETEERLRSLGYIR
jgi:hypothetical protein